MHHASPLSPVGVSITKLNQEHIPGGWGLTCPLLLLQVKYSKGSNNKTSIIAARDMLQRTVTLAAAFQLSYYYVNSSSQGGVSANMEPLFQPDR